MTWRLYYKTRKVISKLYTIPVPRYLKGKFLSLCKQDGAICNIACSLFYNYNSYAFRGHSAGTVDCTFMTSVKINASDKNGVVLNMLGSTTLVTAVKSKI